MGWRLQNLRYKFYYSLIYFMKQLKNELEQEQRENAIFSENNQDK